MKEVILCVDDEKIVLSSLKTQLKRLFGDKFDYEFAESAEEALEIIDDLGGMGVLIIVSDWLMPGIKGDEFLIKVHAKFPGIVKVLLTGQYDEEAAKRAKEGANLHALIQKPWKEEELYEIIMNGLHKDGK
jgi:CheY-like chemotaxis protein